MVRLTRDEQRLVKTTVFDLQINPANPGHQLHKLDRAKDPNFWSVRVGSDIRLIVHRTASSMLICYVDHHDDAYRWAERRKLETHPKTGAAQIVEVREIVREIEVPRYVQPAAPTSIPDSVAKAQPSSPAKPKQPALFAAISDDDLLNFGVPPEWLVEAKTVDVDGLFELAEHLPAEAAEALLELAVGGKPKPVALAPTDQSPFEHPDALRRFRTVANIEELTEALDYPWEKWAIFLHPGQRELVERKANGPVRVSGSAGTGKTVVALHRAVHLAKTNPDAKVLLTTFSPLLANQLQIKVRRLLASDPRIGERLEVSDLNEMGRRLFTSGGRQVDIVGPETLRDLLASASSAVGSKFSLRFLETEWIEVVDAWQLSSWEEYRDVRRLGRKTRLPEAQRVTLWQIFESVQGQLAAQNLTTYARIFTDLAETTKARGRAAFDFVVVDEAQDISVPQLRFLAAIGATRPDALFFAGDLGQRIFQCPFSWLALGVDIRGRSRTLKVNYRTSHQIRTQADRLLGQRFSDVDGNEEDRKGTVSVFNGLHPTLHVSDSVADEVQFVAEWLGKLPSVQPHEICLIVRSDAQLDRCQQVAQRLSLPFRLLSGTMAPAPGHLSICTMHFAKGLEFRAVVVMAVDDDVIPLEERIEAVADDADLEEVYNTERHLLYVACTRARDVLAVTSSGSPSEFLEDLAGK